MISSVVIALSILMGCKYPDSASIPANVGGSEVCIPIDYRSGVFYFPCIGADFANGLSFFIQENDHLEVSAMTEQGIVGYRAGPGFFVVVRANSNR